MSLLQIVGQLDVPAGAEFVRMTAHYPPGFMDSSGVLARGVYGASYAGGAWSAFPEAGAARWPGAGAAGENIPFIGILIVIKRPGLPPEMNYLERLVYANTGNAGEFNPFLPQGNVTTWQGPPVAGGGGSGQGPVGPEGPVGERGTVWHSVSSVPDAALGLPQDWALDTATGDIYSKASGVWVFARNLRGPAGGVGPEGEPGPAPTLPLFPPLPTEAEQEGRYALIADPDVPAGSFPASWQEKVGKAEVQAFSFNADGHAYFAVTRRYRFTAMRFVTAPGGAVAFARSTDGGGTFGNEAAPGAGTTLNVYPGDVLRVSVSGLPAGAWGATVTLLEDL